MIIWLALAALTFCVLVALLAPLFRHHRGSPSRTTRELAIYRDQLAELQREAESGRIPPMEAKAAETEIQRKMLAAAESVDPADTPAAVPRNWSRGVALIVVAAVVPIGALAAYLSVGSPTEPSHPFDPVRAAAQTQAEARAREMAGLVDKLAKRLEREPDNLQGWLILAQSYTAMQRNTEAAEAFRHAYELSGKDATYAADYGEALVAAADATVTPQASALFEQALKADPSEPRSRFYLGLAKAQAGQAREAIAMWRSLETDSPADAQWLPAVREMIRSVAVDAGIDPQSVPAASQAPIAQAPGPTADDVAAAQSMTPDQQQQMIRDMVGGLAQRLEANPNDLEGWKRLGRSYLVLNEPDRAKEAYGRAVALAPTDVALLGDYANATLLAPGRATLPPESVGALRDILKTDEFNPAALWLVGLAEAEAGNRQEAIRLWARLLPQLQSGTPAYQSVQARIEALKATP
jgi:cytochrome c-type biogenesis protein CcmH